MYGEMKLQMQVVVFDASSVALSEEYQVFGLMLCEYYRFERYLKEDSSL
jgi:hypothetical protein